MQEEVKKVGKRIKALRIEKNVTQIDLAKALGISQTNLSNIEQGRTGATLSNLFKIKEILGCSICDFFEEQPTVNSTSLDVDRIIQLLEKVKELEAQN